MAPLSSPAPPLQANAGLLTPPELASDDDTHDAGASIPRLPTPAELQGITGRICTIAPTLIVTPTLILTKPRSARETSLYTQFQC